MMHSIGLCRDQQPKHSAKTHILRQYFNKWSRKARLTLGNKNQKNGKWSTAWPDKQVPMINVDLALELKLTNWLIGKKKYDTGRCLEKCIKCHPVKRLCMVSFSAIWLMLSISLNWTEARIKHISNWVNHWKCAFNQQHIIARTKNFLFAIDDQSSRALNQLFLCPYYCKQSMLISEMISPCCLWFKMCNNKHLANKNLKKAINGDCDEWTRMVKIVMLITLVLAANQFDVCDAKVKIQQIKVPKYIENGTMNSVILDCQYSLDPETDRNLVVKWFFKEDPEPIYQWIFEHDLRRVPQRYQDRVDANYPPLNETNEPWQQYRYLNLIRPTVEMTGRYSCHVICITSEAHDADTMIVYAKTKTIDLVTRRVTRQRTNITAGTDAKRPMIGTAFNITRPTSTMLTTATAKQPDGQTNRPGHDRLSTSAAGLSSFRLDGVEMRSSNKQGQKEREEANQKFDWNETKNANQTKTNAILSPFSVTVTEIECSVENVYPLPELSIYQVLGDSNAKNQRPRSLEKARIKQNSTQLSNGAFRVSMIVSIDDEDLFMMSDEELNSNDQLTIATSKLEQHSTGLVPKPTMFECLVAQDELKHELRKSTLFIPNLAQSWNEPDNEAVSKWLFLLIGRQTLIAMLTILHLMANAFY